MLTLRRIGVLVAHLPADAALVRAVDPEPVWQIADVLLAEIWQAAAQSKQPHPLFARALRHARASTTDTPARLKAVVAARRRARERQDQIDAGLIT